MTFTEFRENHDGEYMSAYLSVDPRALSRALDGTALDAGWFIQQHFQKHIDKLLESAAQSFTTEKT